MTPSEVFNGLGPGAGCRCWWWDTWIDFHLQLGKAVALPSTGMHSSTQDGRTSPGPHPCAELVPLAGGRWYKRHLTYRVVNWPPYLPQHEVRLAVRAAFELWSNVSSLVFWEVRNSPADIRLTFFHGDHNDGLNNAFDGPGAGCLPHLSCSFTACALPRQGGGLWGMEARLCL